MAAKNLNDTVIQKVLDAAKKTKKEKVFVLDLGSGQGYNALRIAEGLEIEKRDFEIHCVDIDKEQFKLSETQKIKFVLGNLNEDISLGKYDFVIGTEIIEHVENPYHFMRLCISHLNEDGICFITTPNVEHIFSLIKQFVLGRPMWFSVNEPSGHIMPIHKFMIQEGLRRLSVKNIRMEQTWNRNCFPLWIKNKRIKLVSLPGKNRIFGEINIFKIYKRD